MHNRYYVSWPWIEYFTNLMKRLDFKTITEYDRVIQEQLNQGIIEQILPDFYGLKTENLTHFRFCRVLFGVISSPFLLKATVKHHLEKSNNPLIMQIAEDIYVDNLVTETNSNSEAIAMHRICKNSFNEIIMNLRAWYSNSSKCRGGTLSVKQIEEKTLNL